MEGVGVRDGAWRGRRVLLTGHTGFKGGWLALWLHRMGARVTGYALPPSTEPSLYQAADIERTLRSELADVRDRERVAAVVRECDPEVVFHLAAQPLVRASYAQPVETFAANVMGTAHLLDALRGAPSARAVVVVTTDKVYENREWERGYREDDALGGHDPYSASKACAELVCGAWRRAFGSQRRWRLATARAGNVFGGGDWAADRLVPDLVRHAMRGEPVPIRNPGSIRPWQHVLEPLAGYIRLADALLEGDDVEGAWNFGPVDDAHRTVHEVADLVRVAWGPSCAWVPDRAEHPHEARALSLDSTRARLGLGWSPRLTLADGIRWTTDWYRSVAAGADARALTLGQIERYEMLS